MRRYNAITGKFEEDDDKGVKTEITNNSHQNNIVSRYNAIENRFENIEPTVTLDNNEQSIEEGNAVQLSTKEIYNLAQENAKTKRNELKEAKKDYQNKLSDEYQKRDVSFKSPISKEKDSVLTYETQNKEQFNSKIEDGKKVQEARKSAENERLKVEQARYNSNLADSQEANARSEAEDVTWWDKTGGNVIRGLSDLASVFDVTGTEYVDENGKKYYLPTYNEYRQQKVSESYDTKVGKLLGDAAYNISKILGSTAVNTVAPGAGTAIYWTDMFTDNYKSAINGGYEKENALLYSAIGTGAEYMTGKFLGSATKGLTGGKTSSLSSAIGNTTNKLIKNPKISSIIGSAGSEATEEFLQEYIENINRLAVLENSTNPDDYIDILTDPDVLEDALYSAGVGAVSGGVTNITDPTGNNIENNINVLTEFKAQLQESKKNSTDSKKIETFDKAIKLVDDYLANPFINEGNISNELNNVLQNTTQNLNTNVQSNSERFNNSAISNQVNTFNLGRNNNVNTLINKNNDSNYNSFSRQVDEVVNGTWDENNHLTVLEHTPQVLQQLGVKDLPITLTSNKLKRIMNDSGNQKGEYHGLGEIVKKIPEAIENPLDIVKSHNNSYVLTTDLSDNNDRSVIVSIKIDGKGYIDNIEVNTNVMTSAYGRNNYDSWMANHQRNGDIVYDIDRGFINEKKLDAIPRLQLPSNNIKFSRDNVQGLQLPNEVTSSTSDITKNTNSFSNDNIPQIGRNVKNGASSSNNINMRNNENNAQRTTNSSFFVDENTINNHKSQQLDIINNSNPMQDDYHTGIRSVDDIKTFREAFDEAKTEAEEGGWTEYASYPDITNDMVEEALNTNEITVYSSNDIKDGVFVTPSYQQALEYAGNDSTKVKSKKVNLDDVAWINLDEGQYAKVSENSTRNTLNENKQEDVLTIEQDNNNITNETSNNKGDGESRFYRNITERSKFLTQENRDKLSTEDYIKYYDTVSNEESMKRALKRLDEGGQAELTRWFAKGADGKAFANLRNSYDSVDVAEGWILLQRAQDNGDYDMMVEVAKKMREIGTKSGQAVQMYNLLSRLTPEGMVKYATSELDEAWQIASKNKSQKWRDKYGDDFQLTPEETQFIVDQMNKVETMKDGRQKNVEIAKVQKMLQDKLPPLKGDGIKSWMRISMLLNPKTQVRNVTGNAIIAPVNAVADTFAAVADKFISKRTGVRTVGNTNLKSYAKGFKNGLFESYEDFKLGINTRNIQGNRFEVSRGKSFNEHHKGILSNQRNALSKGLNRVDSFLSFVLDAGDRGFYEASFTQSINNQLVLNNTTEVTQDMIDIATNEALSRTWQDNNNYTKFVLDIRRGMNKIHIKGYGLGDVLIPFAKTPANLTKAIVDYSPVGLVKTLTADAVKLKNNISNGTITAQQQHQFVQNLGKATAGTLLYVAGMALAQAGITTGANDDDKDVSDFMRNTLGIQPYSIKIGNHSFTYDWAQPVAAPFAITADITRALNNDDVTLQDAITTSLDSGFNILLEQSFLSGIQSVLNSSYGSTTENIIDEVLGLPARAVPTFVKQINDMIDPNTRMVYERNEPSESAKNQVKTKIPGLSDELPVKRDTLGREIEKYGGENNFFNVFLNPANSSKGKVSESAKEIYDVYQATKDKTIMPRSAPNELSITIEDRKGNKKKKELVLDNQDKSDFLEISGGIVEENVKELKDNRYYKKLDDDDKAKVIKEIVDYAYNKAKADLLDVEMSEISGYKTVEKKIKGGTALYDYYAKQVYQDR